VLLARVAERVLGRPTTVVFRVQEDRQRRPQMDFFVAPRESAATATASNIGTTPLNERYSFQTFVIGSRTSSRRLPRTPLPKRRQDVQPALYLRRDGLGKTHLMQAIAHAVLERNPGTSCSTSGRSSSSTT